MTKERQVSLPLYNDAEAKVRGFHRHAQEILDNIDDLDTLTRMMAGLTRCERQFREIRQRAERAARKMLHSPGGLPSA